MVAQLRSTDGEPCPDDSAEASEVSKLEDTSTPAQENREAGNTTDAAQDDEAGEEAHSAEETEQNAKSQKTKKRRRKKKAPAANNVVVETELRCGLEVLINGLTGAVELNGQTGRCEQWNEEAGRWHVRLSSGDIKSLKPQNLSPDVRSTAARTEAPGQDTEFDVWCKRALLEVPSGAENISPEDMLKMDDAFAGYKFTGPLRPAHVTPQMHMPTNCSSIPDYATHPEGECESESRARRTIPVLEGDELETMREACRLGREVLDIASRFMKAGVTGDEIDRIVWQACAERKVYPSPLNYFGFPKSVCVSPNEVICHGIPDCRPLMEGDIVNLDVSICHKGFHADLNETFFIGNCDEESHNLVKTAYSALRAAAQMIRPGTMYRDLGAAIHAETVQGGCAVVPAYCGHGVGRLFHGPPDVPHYKKNKAVGIMKPGHVFTVEPMVNLGNNGGDRTWPDGWTAVTRDGRRSAQFEHTFLVTEDGVELLTARSCTDRTSMPPFDRAMFQR